MSKMKLAVMSSMLVLMGSGLAFADDTLTIPTIATTNLYAGATAVLAGLGILVGICWVLGLFKRAK